MDCRDKQSASRLLCRRPPLNVNSQCHEMLIVQYPPTSTTNLQSTTSSTHSTPYTTTLVPHPISDSFHSQNTHTKRNVPSDEKDAGRGPDSRPQNMDEMLILAALGWSLFLLTFTFALALVVILVCQHTHTSQSVRARRARSRASGHRGHHRTNNVEKGTELTSAEPSRYGSTRRGDCNGTLPGANTGYVSCLV